MNTDKRGLVLMWTSIALVLVGPVIFSLPAICGLFDLSEKGPIGDALGGITAPIIGLASVILLYLTLQEQVKINKEQKRFNDANRILNMSAHISQMVDSLRFCYSSNQGVMVGHGLSTIPILDSLSSGVGIAEEEFNQLFEKIIQLDTITTFYFLTLTDNTLDLSENEKSLLLQSLSPVLEKYSMFYNLVLESRISVFPIFNQQNSLSYNPIEKYKLRAQDLKKNVDERIAKCKS